MPDLLARTNPVARIAGLALLTTPLLLSIDVVSAACCLGAILIALPFTGTEIRRLPIRAWPLFLAAPLSGISMVLYGRPEGTEYISYGWIHVTDNSIQLALAIMVRIFAIGLPAIVMIGRTDPTDLGDSLAQIWHLPAKFVIGTVAGVRLATLFRRDWQAMGRARRSRGLADDGRIVRGVTMLFGLLVLALRRGAKLATAMEARAFGAEITRTWARPTRLHPRDWVLMGGCLAVSLLSLGVAVATGDFRFLGV
ncbi:energy-coupling factor transporter transmembrane component T family protein [Corynebacterium sp. TAE3-ERU16]|uniref:energy-coupling factor transporter transmembrane component T family protein n=1 Tax=Corynebacterium sp. TAE3-ERU16 TaxID=2849493 RepID=UPI001C46F452|nr:energy-coupling factor transporter transmembrane component T [Corynebacterium sp. TAE3-ERU16]MBV7293222.1 energy-coupling factor transporter transmembrane protein EcfT [Corynebacterium sp. TAE3-ERU16]